MRKCSRPRTSAALYVIDRDYSRLHCPSYTILEILGNHRVETAAEASQPLSLLRHRTSRYIHRCSRLHMPHTVADLCRQQSIEVAELANRTGLDGERVLAIALGRWTPSPAERQKIAAVFGVPADQIAWGHSTPIQHLYGHGPG